MNPLGSQPGITLRIVSHKRRKFLEKALKSAFSQTEPFECVELYDNGSNFSPEDLTRRHPALKVRGVPATIPGSENLRRAFVIKPETPYLCVFHDDDLLHAEFAQVMRGVLRTHPDLGAASCNGEVINENGKARGPLLPKLEKNLLLRNPSDFARWYCEGFIPFPVTIYRWTPNFGADLDFAAPFGRCGDVAFLARIVQRQPILLLAAKLFSYRRHVGQDSAGFQWWEETKRWNLQLELCRDDSPARRHVKRKRNERLTSRWLNAWLHGQACEEPWNWAFFSARALHRFARNNKRAILSRLLRGSSKA